MANALIINMRQDLTRKMLRTIRESANTINESKKKPDVPLEETNKPMSFVEEADYLMRRVECDLLNTCGVLKEEDESKKEFVINKNTPQFGDVFTSQEDTLKKTIGESIELGEKALVFYPKEKDLVLSGKITSMNIAFQFRYADPSGDGIYIWANGLQLTEANSRTIGKIRDAFTNWKQNLVQNGDLLDKLQKVASRES